MELKLQKLLHFQRWVGKKLLGEEYPGFAPKKPLSGMEGQTRLKSAGTTELRLPWGARAP